MNIWTPIRRKHKMLWRDLLWKLSRLQVPFSMFVAVQLNEHINSNSYLLDPWIYRKPKRVWFTLSWQSLIGFWKGQLFRYNISELIGNDVVYDLGKPYEQWTTRASWVRTSSTFRKLLTWRWSLYPAPYADYFLAIRWTVLYGDCY